MRAPSRNRMQEAANALRSVMAEHLPKGVRYTLLLTDFDELGVDGTLAPDALRALLEQVLEEMPAKMKEQR